MVECVEDETGHDKSIAFVFTDRYEQIELYIPFHHSYTELERIKTIINKFGHSTWIVKHKFTNFTES